MVGKEKFGEDCEVSEEGFGEGGGGFLVGFGGFL